MAGRCNLQPGPKSPKRSTGMDQPPDGPGHTICQNTPADTPTGPSCNTHPRTDPGVHPTLHAHLPTDLQRQEHSAIRGHTPEDSGSEWVPMGQQQDLPADQPRPTQNSPSYQRSTTVERSILPDNPCQAPPPRTTCVRNSVPDRIQDGRSGATPEKPRPTSHEPANTEAGTTYTRDSQPLHIRLHSDARTEQDSSCRPRSGQIPGRGPAAHQACQPTPSLTQLHTPVFLAIQTDDSAPQSPPHGAQPKEGLCSDNDRNSPRQQPTGITHSADAQTQEPNRDHRINHNDIPAYNKSEAEHPHTQEGDNGRSSHATTPATVLQSTGTTAPATPKQLPQWITRLLDGRHRGPLPSGRTKHEPSWPIHAPNVTTINMQLLIRDGAQPVVERLQRLFDLLQTTLDKIHPTNCRQSSTSTETIQALLSADIIEPADQNLLPNIKVFLKSEEHKHQNRVITWTVAANDALETTYNWDHLTSVQTEITDIVRNQVKVGMGDTYAATADLRASFYQVLIHLQPETYSSSLDHITQITGLSVYPWEIPLPLKLCNLSLS